MKLLGVDVETTGLEPEDDVIIEFGGALYDTDHGVITEVYGGLNHADGIAINPDAFAAHGLTEEIIANQVFDYEVIASLVEQADYLVAHNALFDKTMLEAGNLGDIFENVPADRWLCSMRLIDWETHLPNTQTRALNYIAADLGFANPFPHRAVFDVALMFKVIEPYLEELLANAEKPWARVKALNTPFATKDVLKHAGYHAYYSGGKFRYWYQDVMGNGEAVEAVKTFLANQVYGNELQANINIDIETFDHWSQVPRE